MYRKHYGLVKNPFELTPDPEAVFMSEVHQEALAVLQYGVKSRKSVLVLTGDVGTGKTTLLQVLVHNLEMGVHFCLINNPTLTRNEFFTLLAAQYGLDWEDNKGRFLTVFSNFLEECTRRNERVLLIVDEAHVLPPDLLEEVRLLSNQDVLGQNVLSIFLVGQPELNQRMADDRFLPLRQRISIRFHLQPFSEEETVQYILFRLRHAGAKNLGLFTREAMRLIHEASKGTPRLINIVCDHALLTGFAENKPVIDEQVIRECVEELHFPGEATPLPLPAATEPGWRSPKLLAVLLGGGILVLAVLVVLEAYPGTRGLLPWTGVVPGPLLDAVHRLWP